MVTERRGSLSGGSLRVNGEERNATPASGGGRRRSAAAVPHGAYRGRPRADGDTWETRISFIRTNNLFHVMDARMDSAPLSIGLVKLLLKMTYVSHMLLQ